ncbi:signal peptide peptidase SppA [Chitinophaga horti]|uniref:Signal peptide peptidase SppA n=1 Tax=Chitinophaga horti TaxID=2920382 RepID=A0ABY6IUJ0_9BACT|nr:signal peptide peptidase SppA [Chitinophaga horti]UYQ91040.1 signal peptide peptidase SppA [Chitinophaga horti]
MRSFLKIFFASFLALIVFSVVGFFFLMMMVVGAVNSVTTPSSSVSANSVLVVDAAVTLNEQAQKDQLGGMLAGEDRDVPGVYDMVRLIRHAGDDDNIKGVYLKVGGNGNSFATNEELRNALLAFRKSGKFIYAYAEVIPQQAYYLATAADKIYLNPKGGLEFDGFSMQLLFLKGLLEKLDIHPQIFYAGKFKSATEPLRETQMTDANRLQTSVFLGQLYGKFLSGISERRKIDTATLHQYANEGLIRFPNDALKYKLVDGLKYDDEVMNELRKRIGIKDEAGLNFIPAAKYASAVNFRQYGEDGRIALIYAQGDIVGGKSESPTTIASDTYIKIIRKARQNKDIKAIVFRVNSGGGSALASESIWRELTLARKDKPVIVSMGDYAASGGYYIACMADTIFAQPNTLTGSIGVFAVLPNMQGFFNNKLGITFDGVKTAQYADLGSASRPLTEMEQRILQTSVDTIYESFKGRVVEGRKLAGAVVDSIAQGRVWTGIEAKRLGLVDRLGGLEDAVQCAAKLANLSAYRLSEYPAVQDTWLQRFSGGGEEARTEALKKELGVYYPVYKQVKSLQQLTNGVQARLPFDMMIR